MEILQQLKRKAAAASGIVCILATAALAHPGSGIVVDRQGSVYFVDTGKGVWKIDRGGRLVPHEGPAFHWMTMDAAGLFAGKRLQSFPGAELTPVGTNPTLILSSDFPLTVGHDRALYYPELRSDRRLQVARLTPSGARSVLATLPAATESGPLRWLNGMAAGPAGSIYYSENRAVRRISREGSIATVAESIAVPGCVRPPAATRGRACAVST